MKIWSRKFIGTQKGKLLWQAKKYKSKKYVDLTQLLQKYKNITITVTMKVNGVESEASEKVTVK